VGLGAIRALRLLVEARIVHGHRDAACELARELEVLVLVCAPVAAEQREGADYAATRAQGIDEQAARGTRLVQQWPYLRVLGEGVDELRGRISQPQRLARSQHARDGRVVVHRGWHVRE